MKDPVCGMTVDEKRTKLKSEYMGKTFYFCSAACKSSFDKDPHEYGHQT
jgi:Cu+-exporting ATPase